MECGDCHGKRYTDEVLSLTWQGLDISQILALTAKEAMGVFSRKRVLAVLELLCDVGLEYITLGQPLSTLSGGECQRMKLVAELGKKDNLYVLDEPTTGMHMADVDRLMSILERLVCDKNSVIVIEHNLEAGTPEKVATTPESHTGRYLARFLSGNERHVSSFQSICENDAGLMSEDDSG